MDTCPSGHQIEIAYNDQRATVVEVGGGIRRYEVAGRSVLDPYPIDSICDGAHGAPLIPWPNRLADGQYRFDGVQYQVALSEPEKHNAIHGLLRWRAWQVMRTSTSRVTMGVRLHPMQGYPFLLDVEVDYALDGDGLTVTTTATNAGMHTCPYGAGQHPYLSPGVGLIDQCTLQLEAGARIVTDDERQLPIGTEAVDRTTYDFREPRLLGATTLDFAFTDLVRDAEGRAWARLGGTDGRQAEIWVDESYPIIELYTGDTLAPERRRKGLGAEPMTCPPNAFASGDRLIRLEPGQSVSTAWGACLT
ncbi:MAG TPA: aldose 1-epimerase family protein [Acidimicrobiales bacterium]|nr:aldose 1-epimerase family protein [Acidimicrobiales bacterium]